MRHILLKITFVAVVIFLQTAIAFACTCPPKRSVLDEYEASPVVVIARVVSVEKAAKQDKTTHDYGVRSSRLVVEKVYKGDIRAGDEILMGQGDGMNCQMRFSEENIGLRGLYYLGVPREGTPLHVTFCSRSTSVDRATEDLLYLDKLDQVRGKTRVSGKYEGGFYRKELNVAGRKVRLVSEGDTYETITDEHGVFEIYDLPPGNYRLEPDLQPGLTLDFAWIRHSSGGINRDQPSETSVAFTLKPNRHMSIGLGFKSKDQMGRGKAAPNVSRFSSATFATSSRCTFQTTRGLPASPRLASSARLDHAAVAAAPTFVMARPAPSTHCKTHNPARSARERLLHRVGPSSAC